jgi:magnesium transporter
MIEYYRSVRGSLQRLEAYEAGCWVNVVSPTPDELTYLSQQRDVPMDYLLYSLDLDERPRFERDGDYVLIVMQTSFAFGEAADVPFDTLPLGIIHTPAAIVTVSTATNPVLEEVKAGRIRGLSTVKRNRFTMQIFLRVAQRYLLDLRQINRQVDVIETKERIRRDRVFEMYPDDHELFEDVLIENLQAIEMTDIATNILVSMMGAFASVISNNVNAVVKVLTVATIMVAIPTWITGIFGMNVALPFQERPWAFALIIGLCVAAAAGLLLWFRIKRWL